MTFYRCDVSNREEVFKVAKKVKKEVGDVTILINNAGVGIVKTFLNYSNDEVTRTINVNLIAHYWVSDISLVTSLDIYLFRSYKICKIIVNVLYIIICLEINS
jgi:short-subunit dehydrogenase